MKMRSKKNVIGKRLSKLKDKKKKTRNINQIKRNEIVKSIREKLTEKH